MGGKGLVRIKLPVCPECHQASAVPRRSKRERHYCIGPVDARHVQTEMREMAFVEDRTADGGD